MEQEIKPVSYWNKNNVARRNLMRGLAEVFASTAAQIDELYKSNQPIPEEMEIKVKIKLLDSK